jgi:uncharacterized protein YqgC (DUF456 family)
MPARIKKLIGTAILLPALMLYFFAAAALGELVPNHQFLKAVYYLAAGVAWAFPTKYFIGWMNADPVIAPPAPDRD